MQLRFKLENKDFLAYQLYATSKSKASHRKRLISKLAVPVIYIAFGIHFYLTKDNINGLIIFTFLGLVWLLLYPKYAFWKYNKYLKKYIEQNYKDRTENDVVLQFNDDTIEVKDFVADGAVKVSEVKELIELPELFLIKMVSETSLIIPKLAVENTNELKAQLATYGAEYIDETKWVWS